MLRAARPRRAGALLLAAAAAASSSGALAYDRRGGDGDGEAFSTTTTAVRISASSPLRRALSSAASGILPGGSAHLLPSPLPLGEGFSFLNFFTSASNWSAGFPTQNSFASASVPPTNLSNQSSDGNSDDSKCCPGCINRNTIAKAAAAVGPAVVNISSTQETHGWVLEKSIGSGTIIDPDGTILTCAHVVLDFQSTKPILRGKVSVTLQDGREFEGTVLNADRHSDIAVVKIKSKTPLPSANLGSSSKLRPGDWVVALGCPLSLQNTVTAGIVSCVDRKSSDLGLGGIRREYLQTDCAINKGNSGGPLVNLDGEIVGVNVMKVWAADGLSFAVPIDSIVKIVENFKKNGRVVRPWLGLKMLDLNPMIIAQLKERSSSFPDVKNGVLVPMVTPGSPAEHAGFRPGDVVVEFDGKLVESIKEIIDIMGDKVGVPFKVLVKRASNVTVSLTVIPEEADSSR
ncbi:putative protease Do-like 14 [Oryza glaberrima]|uniref:putative protease Do-like 14 n=1 Tax=Oryza glaberrima TaxID=4538 RepID=UPI00224C1EAA|nr:putative protease Do-like 14 [Oryza glaberrima]XP_052135111.1 putative protease Do-like 14 [Oryza glaberrima]